MYKEEWKFCMTVWMENNKTLFVVAYLSAIVFVHKVCFSHCKPDFKVENLRRVVDS